MYKGILLCLLAVTLLWLTGCSGSDDVDLGEGTGFISADDFDPFGSVEGPINLRYFTIPRDGTYQVTLSSGPGQPPLPNPRIRLLEGQVDDNNIDFLGAYAGGAGVLAEDEGSNIAQITITAAEGERFTLVFSSATDGTGAYSWRVTEL
ncbi:MAG: hypothetical protein ACYC63_17760 [Armatimonadota bacterium]